MAPEMGPRQQSGAVPEKGAQAKKPRSDTGRRLMKIYERRIISPSEEMTSLLIKKENKPSQPFHKKSGRQFVNAANQRTRSSCACAGEGRTRRRACKTGTARRDAPGGVPHPMNPIRNA